MDEILGDPAGQATATYWDAWFKSICIPTGRSFEWYTSPTEVERILTIHIPSHRRADGKGEKKNTSIFEDSYIIHPGSGTSLLPIYLRDKYSSISQSVIDCSDVAIREMQTRHDALYSKRQTIGYEENIPNLNSSCCIDYVVGDILSDKIPYPDEKFHAWVDKGLVDALFSSFEDSDKIACRQLFSEANRILHSQISFSKTKKLVLDYINHNDNENEMIQNGGICLVVTLAQDHSLRLILDAVDHNNNNCDIDDMNENMISLCWKPIIHVYELEQLHKSTSNLCPFGFVLEKSVPEIDDFVNSHMPNNESKNHIIHKPTIVFHSLNDENETIDLKSIEKSGSQQSSFSTLFGLLRNKLEAVRSTYSADNRNDTKENELKRLVITSLHIKPSSDYEMSCLDALSNRITTRGQYLDTFSTLKWRKSEISPIGFGIFKLILECLIESDGLDELCELIMDLEGDDIQSVDIDWDLTVPVGDAMNCLQKLSDI